MNYLIDCYSTNLSMLASKKILQESNREKNLFQLMDNYSILLHLACVLAFICIGMQIWKLLFCPMKLYRDSTNFGYITNPDKICGREYQVSEIKSKRKLGKVPPVYPNGWFKVIDSDELPINSVRSVYALGEHFAVFRNTNGVVRVLDAYCPHLGADMAAGGRVVNEDCLQCPFHGWTFSGSTGKCVDIPYTKKVLDFVSVKTYNVQEINGIVCVWYHCDGVPPQWENPKLPELKDLKYVGRTEHVVDGHIQDIPENAADLAHLNFLHKPLLHRDIDKYDSTVNVLEHNIDAEWKRCKEPGNLHTSIMTIIDNTHLNLFGWKFRIKQFNFKVKQIGPGVVHLDMNTAWLRGTLIQTTTPVAPLQQKLSHVYYVDRRVPMFIAKLFLYFQSIQIDRDVVVWNNKTYLQKPAFVREESALADHRRWFSQFYSKNSPRVDSNGRMQEQDLSW